MQLSRWMTGATFAAALLGSTAMAQAEIVIASAGPMTGAYAAFGEQLRRGAEQAVKDINAAGGVNGEQLRLAIGDDACDPKQAVAVANDLADQGAVFVAGHFCSGSSIPAGDVYAEQGILQISPASTNPAYTEGPFENGITTVFRTCGRDDQQGDFAGKWMAENFKGKNVAVIHDKSTYGKGLADLTKQFMNEGGLQEVSYEAITAGDKDFTALITKLKSQNVEAIYFGGYHTEAALIARQAAEQGLNAPLFSGDALNTIEYAQLAGPASDGTRFTNAAEARNLPTAQKVVEEFKASGYDPEGYTLSTYAAVQVWAAAANEAGTTDAAQVAETMRSKRWDTVIGSIGFDEKGDLTENTYVWFEYKDGAYTQVQ
ncbi:branched-chain amino acid ABC transporter substrate-binding protein [Geminicoccus harenae]|uniref:branched-chain amino acid ABC transporter substrate-binding protein n=1 Tax=Geminicoccus harenae TaxID=2498453 RepID=UPI001CC2B9C5|nr:branched-chain amino acid ABC transporter substrate-binding protein [Geminicoccus harenae]